MYIILVKYANLIKGKIVLFLFFTSIFFVMTLVQSKSKLAFFLFVSLILLVPLCILVSLLFIHSNS